MHEELRPTTSTLKPTGKETAQPEAPELPLMGHSTSGHQAKKLDNGAVVFVPTAGSKSPDRRRMDAHLTGGNRNQRRNYIRRSKRVFRLAYGFGARHNRRLSGAQSARNRRLSSVQERMGQVSAPAPSEG